MDSLQVAIVYGAVWRTFLHKHFSVSHCYKMAQWGITVEEKEIAGLCFLLLTSGGQFIGIGYLARPPSQLEFSEELVCIPGLQSQAPNLNVSRQVKVLGYLQHEFID